MPKNISKFQLLCMARNAGPENHHDLVVLERLIYRSRAESGFMCFPSVGTICADARMKRTSVFKALNRLEDAGYIERVKRQNHANLYYVQTDFIQAREEKRKSLNLEKTPVAKEGQTPLRSAASTEESSEDIAGSQKSMWLNQELNAVPVDFDGAPPPGAASSGQVSYPERDGSKITMTELVDLVLECLPDHPSFLDYRFDRAYFRRDLGECCRLAGSIGECAALFVHVLDNEPKVQTNLAGAKNLGAYLKACFPGWEAKYFASLSGG